MPTTYLLFAMLAIVAIHFLFPGALIIPPMWNLLGIIPKVSGVALNLVMVMIVSILVQNGARKLPQLPSSMVVGLKITFQEDRLDKEIPIFMLRFNNSLWAPGILQPGSIANCPNADHFCQHRRLDRHIPPGDPPAYAAG